MHWSLRIAHPLSRPLMFILHVKNDKNVMARLIFWSTHKEIPNLDLPYISTLSSQNMISNISWPSLATSNAEMRTYLPLPSTPKGLDLKSYIIVSFLAWYHSFHLQSYYPNDFYPRILYSIWNRSFTNALFFCLKTDEASLPGWLTDWLTA